jgi:ATP-dependent helicase/nuclease subunit A
MSEIPPSGIILASAGTGKTFQLTGRYAALLRAGVDPSRILATTFTRAAAGQIFDRVVARLLEAPDAGPLTAVLHRLDRLGICTLDSLFARLASAYAADLGLPPGWRIVDDDQDERLRAHAVELALEDGDRDDLLTLLRLMMAKRFSSAVAASLLDRVEDAHGVFCSAPPEAWTFIDVPADVKPLPKAEMIAVLSRWSEVPLHLVQGGTRPNEQWESAHAKAFEAAAREDWDAFVKSGLAGKILAGEASFSRGPITDAVVRAYEPLLRHARWALLSRHVEGTRALHDLLGRFDRAYAGLKRTKRAYRFDDIPRALRAVHDGITLDEIAFRLDGAIDHVLLDEFQDTSASQFALLEPLVAEIVSGGGGLREDANARSVLCVGDVKQSLYQWRDAEPALFAALPRRWPHLERSELHVSYRSSPVVLEAVNRVFENLQSNPVLAGHTDAARGWQNGFKAHAAADTLRDTPGFVRMSEAPASGGGQPQDVLTLRAAAQRAANIVKACPAASIAILVRAKKRIPRLIFELKRLGVDASEEGGNPLTDAPAVAAALSALQFADHPGDTAAAFHVATSPLAEVVGLRDWTSSQARRFAASRIREKTLGGIAPLLGAWLDAIERSCDARDVRRFEQLITLAELFDARCDPRIENFVRMARSRKVDDPAAHPVRVLTVHGSKGLEFDLVVLPDLDGRVASQPPAMLVRRSDPFGEIDAVTRYPNESLRLLDPRLKELHRYQQDKAVSEELSVLYVAMTRAKHAIEIVVAPLKSRKDSNSTSASFSHAGLLRAALAPTAPTGGDDLFHMGDEHWAASLAPAAAPMAGPPLSISLARDASPGRMGRETPPGRARMRGGGDARAAARGTVWHAWAQEVGWLDEPGAADDRALLEVARRLLPDPALDLRAELADFRRGLASVEVRSALSRTRYSARARLVLRREVPFAFTRRGEAVGTARVVTGRIDRLVVEIGQDGSATFAEVLDFKTGDQAGGTDTARLREAYGHQLETYRMAATRLTNVSPASVRCALVLLDAGKVVIL